VTSRADVPLTNPDAVSFAFLDARLKSAVEGVAANDPNPSDPFRGLYISDELALSLADGEPSAPVDERLAEATALLGLDLLDSAVLGLCAAPDLNPRYGRLYAYLQDDVTRKLASPRLVAHLLEGEGVSTTSVLDCFAHHGKLRSKGVVRLLENDGSIPVAERQIKVHDRLAAFLLGARLDQPRIDGRLRRPIPPPIDPGRPALVEELRGLLRREAPLPIVVAGPDSPSLMQHALGRQLLVANIRDIDNAEIMGEAALLCAIEGMELCFDGAEDLEPGDRARVLRVLEERHSRTLIVATSRAAATQLGERTALLFEVPTPDIHERERAWSELTGAPDAKDVAAKFRLSIGQIAEAAQAARLTADGHGAELPTPEHLDFGARQASSSRLGELAHRLNPGWGWDDLIVPAKQLDQLQSISAYLRHRDRVLTDWGYERIVNKSQGLKALFAGESGTGKTMAAQVLGRELGLEIYRVDLATIVSKYIGETEKNLDRIFGAADGSNAILFFDEADALFGKRSEVSDSHDRYANIEVAYLLQKMEGYAGAVILATNYRRNIDDAFLRRLDFVIDFPFPEPEDRKRIWKKLLPPEAPLSDEVDIDFLAERFKLSGGAIRNCTLSAAFQAADDTDLIEMRHLVRAVALEYGKLGRLTLETDFQHFHVMLKPTAPNGNGAT
jgi:hypothetical protein